MSSYISDTILSRINLKTTLSKKTILKLAELSPALLRYLHEELNKKAEAIQVLIGTLNFKSGWSSAAIIKIEYISSIIDEALEKTSRVFQVIPWESLAKNNEEFARLIDTLKKTTEKIPGFQFKFFDIPGLQDVNSIGDLRRKKNEYAFQMQQMVNVRYASDLAKAELYEELKNIQRWIDTIFELLGDGETTYTFTGTITSTQSSIIAWSAGTFTAIGVDHTIVAGQYEGLTKGDWYLYYDRGSSGASMSFAVTDGYNTAGTEDNIRVAHLIVTNDKAIDIYPYNNISQ